MRLIVVVVLAITLWVSNVSAAGLGDTITDIEKQFYKGYRKEFPSFSGGKTIHLGSTYRSYIMCGTGPRWFAFGNPVRVGRIEGNAEGLFGASSGINPNRQQFFKGIKELMPRDFKLIDAYEGHSQSKAEIYTFKSTTLVKLPSIADSFAYTKPGLGAPIGTFYLGVYTDVDDPNRISSFVLLLGAPNSAETNSMKKKTIDPFR